MYIYIYVKSKKISTFILWVFYCLIWTFKDSIKINKKKKIKPSSKLLISWAEMTNMWFQKLRMMMDPYYCRGLDPKFGFFGSSCTRRESWAAYLSLISPTTSPNTRTAVWVLLSKKKKPFGLCNFHHNFNAQECTLLFFYLKTHKLMQGLRR